MSDDQLRETLQAEYFYLQGVIEEFDSRALTIKAWSISFSLAAIAGAFASQAYLVFLVAFVSALLFWFLEATWKSFQLGYYQRAEAIERHFQGEAAPIAPLQIGATWFRHWSVRRLDAMGADDAVAACRASARGGRAHRRVAVRADGAGNRAPIATRCAGPQRGPARFGFFCAIGLALGLAIRRTSGAASARLRTEWSRWPAPARAQPGFARRPRRRGAFACNRQPR